MAIVLDFDVLTLTERQGKSFSQTSDFANKDEKKNVYPETRPVHGDTPANWCQSPDPIKLMMGKDALERYYTEKL